MWRSNSKSQKKNPTRRTAAHFESPVLKVAEPEGVQALVDSEHGLDAVDEQLQALLEWRNLVRQRHVPHDLQTNRKQSQCRLGSLHCAKTTSVCLSLSCHICGGVGLGRFVSV